VAAGRADVVLAGVVDEIAPLTHGLLDRFGALARRRCPGAAPAAEAAPVGTGPATRQAAAEAENGGEVARPFDRRRNGVVAAEGATVLVIEAEEAVRRRGKAPLAHIRGWGSAFDPSAPPAAWGCGHEALGRAVRRLLARCAVPAAATAGPLPAGTAGGSPGAPVTLAGSLAAMSAIDRIVSGASGARAGDRLEAQVLRAAWRELPLPPVLVPKGVTGEYGGGFLAAVVLAAAGAPFGPPAGFREPDPELGVVPHDGAPLPPPALLLASSLAAGGAATWVVLGRV
jgi:3-oxoacyl-[acyl-carrier-protein] synthase II